MFFPPQTTIADFYSHIGQRHRTINFLLISALLLLTILFSSNPALASLSAVDVLGRKVTLQDTPQRVVLGFYYEDYLAIGGPGALDRVVGISLSPWKDWRPKQFSAYLKALPAIADIPNVGDTETGDFSIEKVISLKPDLVIMAAWAWNSLGENTRQFEQAGVPVLVLDYNAQTLEKHLSSTRALGKLLGTEKRAEQLATNYKAAFDDTMDRVHQNGPSNKKVYVELAKKGPGEIGNSYGDGMWGTIIDQVGGINIAKGQIGNWGPLSPEYVLAQQPDVVLLAGSEWLKAPQAVSVGFGADPSEVDKRLKAYVERPGWNALPAVKNGNVHAIYHGGTRTMSDFIYSRYIAKILYPAAFVDVEPDAEIRQYYKTWLPIEADGVYVQQLGSVPKE